MSEKVICIACDGDSFSIKKDEDLKVAFIRCDKCGKANGVLEDVDFQKWSKDMYRNHGFFEKRFNDLEAEFSSLKKQNVQLRDLLETILHRLT